MIWNPGDDTDLNEGGAGTDTVEVNGGNGAEQFTTTANGTRVRFDRLNPAPFSIDIGTSENLVLNANGGDDSFSATGNLAALIKITVDGGTGNDTLLGSNGIDMLLGGDGNDFVDGQQGNDVGFLGAGDDTFQWDPGDGSDVDRGPGRQRHDAVQRQRRQRAHRGLGQRRPRALHPRHRQHRHGPRRRRERSTLNALGGADTLTVNDLSGTDVTSVNPDLRRGSAAATTPRPTTSSSTRTNGDDVATVTGSGANVLGARAGRRASRSPARAPAATA